MDSCGVIVHKIVKSEQDPVAVTWFLSWVRKMALKVCEQLRVSQKEIAGEDQSLFSGQYFLIHDLKSYLKEGTSKFANNIKLK